MATEMIWDIFLQRTPSRNLGLAVEDKIFWVSREGLAELSPVFDKPLFGQFREAASDVAPLPGKKPNETLELLRCLFRSGTKIKNVDEANIFILLKLADEYQIAYLIEECTKFLLMHVILFSGQKSKISDLFRLGVQYKLKEVVRATFPVISRFESIQFMPFFKNLLAEIRCAILLQNAAPQSSDHDLQQTTYVVCGLCSLFDSIHNPKREYVSFQSTKAGLECQYCMFRKCANCSSTITSGFYDKCHVCHKCRKRFSLNAVTTNICLCIDPAAETELKKAGV